VVVEVEWIPSKYTFSSWNSKHWWWWWRWYVVTGGAGGSGIVIIRYKYK
jgi:hypothetical protein